MKQFFSVIIPGNIQPWPSEREITAAQCLLPFFNTDIKLVPRNNKKSADYLINRQYWELKSLTSDGKRTIQHALHRAVHQSCNIVIDARFSKMHLNRIRAQLKHEFSHMRSIKRLVLIEKDGKVVELFR